AIPEGYFWSFSKRRTASGLTGAAVNPPAAAAPLVALAAACCSRKKAPTDAANGQFAMVKGDAHGVTVSLSPLSSSVTVPSIDVKSLASGLVNHPWIVAWVLDVAMAPNSTLSSMNCTTTVWPLLKNREKSGPPQLSLKGPWNTQSAWAWMVFDCR